MASVVTPGLILLGNSGVGKSFLANRLLDDDEAFESRFSARSVTRHTEWKDMTTAIGKHTYSVANIPGLVEANQKLIDENRREIMNAFEQCPIATVLFVFGHKNGRIPDEDLVAFMRINDAYDFPHESLLLIVNGVPTNRPDDYEEKTRQLLSELTNVNESHVYFIEKSTSEKSNRDIHDRLYEAIAKCEPKYHNKKHDIELVADEIAELKMKSKQQQDQLLAQENEYSNKKQKLNLTPNPTIDQHRLSSQEFPIETIQTKPIAIYQDQQQFDDLMTATRLEHDQNMKKLKQMQDDPNRDAIKQLTQQLQMGSEQNQKLMHQAALAPSAIGYPQVKQPHKSQGVMKTLQHGVNTVVEFFDDVLFGPPREPQQDRNPQGGKREHNSQPPAPSSLNQHHNNPH